MLIEAPPISSTNPIPLTTINVRPTIQLPPLTLPPAISAQSQQVLSANRLSQRPKPKRPDWLYSDGSVLVNPTFWRDRAKGEREALINKWYLEGGDWQKRVDELGGPAKWIRELRYYEDNI